MDAMECVKEWEFGRRASPHQWHAMRALLASQLPRPSYDGDEEEVAHEQQHALALDKHLRRLKLWFHHREEQWQWQSDNLAQRRIEREDNREWLRLLLRSWREVADGLRAGAAVFKSRWDNNNTRFRLSRRLHIGKQALPYGPQRQLGGWVAAILQYMRLVRAAKVRKPIQKVSIRTVAVDGTISRRDSATRGKHGVGKGCAICEGGCSLGFCKPCGGSNTRKRIAATSGVASKAARVTVSWSAGDRSLIFNTKARWRCNVFGKVDTLRGRQHGGVGGAVDVSGGRVRVGVG